MWTALPLPRCRKGWTRTCDFSMTSPWSWLVHCPTAQCIVAWWWHPTMLCAAAAGPNAHAAHEGSRHLCRVGTRGRGDSCGRCRSPSRLRDDSGLRDRRQHQCAMGDVLVSSATRWSLHVCAMSLFSTTFSH